MNFILFGLMVLGLIGCANVHGTDLGPGTLVRGLLAGDPNSLTREDREIMAREQAEADAAEAAAKKASAP